MKTIINAPIADSAEDAREGRLRRNLITLNWAGMSQEDILALAENYVTIKVQFLLRHNALPSYPEVFVKDILAARLPNRSESK